MRDNLIPFLAGIGTGFLAMCGFCWGICLYRIYRSRKARLQKRILWESACSTELEPPYLDIEYLYDERKDRPQ